MLQTPFTLRSSPKIFYNHSPPGISFDLPFLFHHSITNFPLWDSSNMSACLQKYRFPEDKSKITLPLLAFTDEVYFLPFIFPSFFYLWIKGRKWDVLHLTRFFFLHKNQNVTGICKRDLPLARLPHREAAGGVVQLLELLFILKFQPFIEIRMSTKEKQVSMIVSAIVD